MNAGRPELLAVRLKTVVGSSLFLALLVVGGPALHGPDAQEKGRILSIITEKNVFKRSETIAVKVEVQNLQGSQRHQLLALNIIDAAEKPIYDSNLVKQNIEFVIGPGERKTIGPFTFKIPSSVTPGTYNLLVGYREYPWDPLIEFKGAKWCPPIRTIRID